MLELFKATIRENQFCLCAYAVACPSYPVLLVKIK